MQGPGEKMRLKIDWLLGVYSQDYGYNLTTTRDYVPPPNNTPSKDEEESKSLTYRHVIISGYAV